MSRIIIKPTKLAKSPWTWFVVVVVCLVYLFIVSSINTIEVINGGTSMAQDFHIIVEPTKKVYVLGDIAPGQSKSVWFLGLHDGQAGYVTTIDNVQVKGVIIGYFSTNAGRNCKLRLPDGIGKPKGECS